MPDLRDTVAIGVPARIEPVPAAPAATPPTQVATPVKREAPPGWVLIGAPLFGYGLLFALSFVIALALATKFQPTPAQISGVLREILSEFSLMQLLNAVLYAIIFFLMWLLLPKRGAAALSSWFRPVSRLTVTFAAATGLLLSALLFWGEIWLVTHNVTQFHETAGEKALVPPSPLDVLPGLIFVAVIVPVVEETYFRGLLLKWLQSRTYTFIAVPISAVVFAAIHGKFLSHETLEGWILTAFLTGVGIVSAIWALASRSLWPSVVVHGSYNGAVIAVPLLLTWLGGA